MTCKELILEKLRWMPQGSAVHEICIEGYSQNNIATRMNDLEREGKLVSFFPEGKRFKRWKLQKWEGDQMVML